MTSIGNGLKLNRFSSRVDTGEDAYRFAYTAVPAINTKFVTRVGDSLSSLSKQALESLFLLVN